MRASWCTSPPAASRARPPTSEIHAREILTLRGRLNQIYVEHTGQDIGIIDEVVTTRPAPEAEAASGG